MEIEIINGPTLNLLGVREPGIYGSEGFDTYLAALRQKYPDVTINYYQSNEEGKLIDRIHATGFTADGIILNAHQHSTARRDTRSSRSGCGSTHIQCAQTRRIPPQVDDFTRLHGRDMRLRARLVPPCARGNNRGTRGKTEINPATSAT